MSSESPTPSRLLHGAAVLADPLVAELLTKRLVVTLATIEPDGSPHVVPLWFAVNGDDIVFATDSQSRKVRNVSRDPRATVMLHDSRPGAEVCGSSIAGRIEIVTGAEAAALVQLVHRRYLDENADSLPDAVAFFASDDVALRLHPERAVTWDERSSVACTALREAGAALALEPTSPRP